MLLLNLFTLFYDEDNGVTKLLGEKQENYINHIQDGLFRGCSRMRGGRGGAKRPPPLPKICHTYLTMMKLGTVMSYSKKIQKINKSRDTPLSSADISSFSLEISKFCYIKKYRYRLYFDA